MIKKRSFVVLIFLLGGLLLTSFMHNSPLIKYMQEATIKSSTYEEESFAASYIDPITNDSIYLQRSKNGIPLYYFKSVTGDVCLSEECRLLDLIVYWNITGRYLGFEIPDGEFLSKHDHEPFSNNEYERLHTILADSSIPLDAVSFEKLVEQPNGELDNVDAISGATSKNVADMVVKGAAYTTYKLWNVVNGPIMDFVSEITEKELSSDLIQLILRSPDTNDRLWALNRIKSDTELTPELENSIFEIISSDDFYLAYKAIRTIDPVHLISTDIQDRLFSEYKDANHSIQKELIKKLMQAPTISTKVVDASKNLLPQLNGQQLDSIFKLYSKHQIKDLETCKSVARILENENGYISKKAYEFLLNVQTDDENILSRLKAYKNIATTKY